jgi:HSP20 family protein
MRVRRGKEVEMSLVRRTSTDVGVPKWFTGRRLFDFPELFDLSDVEMKIEEFQEDGTLVVRAELPGVDPDKDVEVTVTDHVLRIKAERRHESKTEDSKGFRSEFRYGSFVRTLALPVGATEDDVKATYTDGVLEIRVPVDTSVTDAKKVAITRM